MDRELVWVKSVSFLSALSMVAWGRFQGVYLNEIGQVRLVCLTRKNPPYKLNVFKLFFKNECGR